jgi:tRNA A37 N6-isopentenylltransferase MiaA
MGILDKAIKSLAPDSNFTTDGIKITQWISVEIHQPSEQEIQVEIARLQAEYDAKEYQRQRAAEYPDFKDYLDGIVKGDQAQIQAYIDACNAVKNKYPKGQV